MYQGFNIDSTTSTTFFINSINSFCTRTFLFKHYQYINIYILQKMSGTCGTNS